MTRTKRYIIGIILVALTALMSVFFVKYICNKGVYVPVFPEADETFLQPVESGDVYETEFETEAKLMCGIALNFSVKNSVVKGEPIVISLLNPDTGDLIAALESSTGTLNNTTTRRKFSFPVPVVNPGGKMLLRVQFGEMNLSEGVQLRFLPGDSAPLDFGVLELKKDAFYYLCVLMFTLITILVGVTYYMLFISERQLSLEWVYLPSGLILGLIFLLVLPVGGVPDESLHMYKAYEIANTMIGEPVDKETLMIKMRPDDADLEFDIYNFNREYIDECFDGLFSRVNDTRLIQTENIGIWEKHVYYYPAAIGINIGRLFKASPVMTLLIGRLINMLLFTLAAWYSIRKIPFAKGMAFVWAVLPITLQQVISLSRDSMMMSLCMVIISLTLYFAYGTRTVGEVDEKKARRALRFEAILLALCCLILLPLKNFACITVCAFPFILLIKPIKNKLIKISEKHGVKKVAFLSITACLLALIALFAGGFLVMRVLTFGDERVMRLFTHPSEFAMVFINTLWIQMNNYFFGMLGAQLGWMNILLPSYMVVPFILALVLLVFVPAKTEPVIYIPERIFMWAVFFGEAFLAILGMYFFWTPVGYTSVIGVQGRYFLPSLMVALVPFWNRSVKVSEGAERIMLLGITFWQLIICFGIIGNVG